MENEISEQPNITSLTTKIRININNIVADKKIDLNDVAEISFIPLQRLENIASGTAQQISLSEIVAIAHALEISEIELLS